MSHKQSSVLDNYPNYAMNIGIEVHVQLTTASKIFCATPNGCGTGPNSCLCVVCAGYPGVLPVLNKKVIDLAIATGLATNCSITRRSLCARKHYFYPDLPKGYQITQAEEPICTQGYIPIVLEDGTVKKIRLIRIHIEEDAGKNLHTGSNESFVDLNRAGTPLLEIVSYPDITSTYEAKAYLKALHQIVRAIGVCTGNMDEGAFRADTNISVRKKDATEFGTRCELKNINSFKFIGDAIEYEIERQITLLEEGGKVVQQTRLWDTQQKVTRAMRSKEEAADYRYFIDPDLPVIEVDDAWIERCRQQLPELPFAKAERFVREHGLSVYEADIMVDDMDLAAYYEQARTLTQSKQLVNWLLRDLLGYVKEHKITIADCLVKPEHMAQLMDLLDTGAINAAAAKEVFATVATTGQRPADVVKEKGLEQIGSEKELEELVLRVLQAYPEQLAQYRSGKDKMFGFFVGQVMKETKGKGNPVIINDLLKKHI